MMNVLRVLLACLLLASCGTKAERTSVRDVAVRTDETKRTRYHLDGIEVVGDFSVAEFERIQIAVRDRLEAFEKIIQIEVENRETGSSRRWAYVTTRSGPSLTRDRYGFRLDNDGDFGRLITLEGKGGTWRHCRIGQWASSWEGLDRP